MALLKQLHVSHRRCFRRHPDLSHSARQNRSSGSSRSVLLSFLSFIYDGCSFGCFLLHRGLLSLLSLPSPCFCCSNVLSDPHITAEPPKLRTDTLSSPQIQPPINSCSYTQRGKRSIKRKRKRDQDVEIPGNVSRCVAGEAAAAAAAAFGASTASAHQRSWSFLLLSEPSCWIRQLQALHAFTAGRGRTRGRWSSSFPPKAAPLLAAGGGR